MKSSQDENHDNTCPSPPPSLSTSSCFRDISNLKTPRHHSSASKNAFHSQRTPKFFTASKQKPFSSTSTAASSRRRRRSTLAHSTTVKSRAAAANRLKAFELEISQSSRKEQLKKEKSLRALSRSLTAWLNFLFDNPGECGCRVGRNDLQGGVVMKTASSSGKRDSWLMSEDVRVDGLSRWPKRQREGSWSEVHAVEEVESEIVSSKFGNLEKSLRDVCSFEDLKERMRKHLSLAGCKEVFHVISRVAKNIEEGRLKMKAHCPLVTDFGMKETVIKVLLSYNPKWLRIGMYIVFGGESLLSCGESTNDQDDGFLKMVIEKQFFSHAALAKAYAYNKLVEGLYKPGYFETLGNVILKRFLLLVLILDRAKSSSSLPMKYGLDGLDGGSPLLFNPQCNVKSSQQMITDFLTSEVMHGEGDLLSHLTTIGYKVSHQQLPLNEYDFKVGDLFQDIQDGVRLCRAIHLLRCDPSILMKVVLPADNSKKNLANCNLALQYSKKLGVSLHDEDGVLICGEDIVNGDKELTLSLLWNMFIYLQLPLLITKSVLYEEIANIKKDPLDITDIGSSTDLDMLLNWIKAICKNYDNKMENSKSLVDGKAMWCLLDFYFRKELHCSCSKGVGDAAVEESIVSSTDTTDAVYNFVLSQKLTTLLGSVPAVIQTCDILNGACNDRSVIILLVFLSCQLLVKKSKDQLNFHKLLGCHCRNREIRRSSLDKLLKSNETEQVKEAEEEHLISEATDMARRFKAVKTWWQEMAKRDGDCIIKPSPSSTCFQTSKKSSKFHKENAAVVIQSNIRRMIEHQNYLKTRNAVIILQSSSRAWLNRKHTLEKNKINITNVQDVSHEVSKPTESQQGVLSQVTNGKKENDPKMEALADIQRMKNEMFMLSDANHIQQLAAITIQSAYRGWLARRHLEHRKQSVIRIQRAHRWVRFIREIKQLKTTAKSVTMIQSYVRGELARKEAAMRQHYIVLIQSHFRGWSARRLFLSQKEAAICIQSASRAIMCSKTFCGYKQAAIVIQRFVRGRITRTRLLGASHLRLTSVRSISLSNTRQQFQCTELKIVLSVIVKAQRWWRRIQTSSSRVRAAEIIQSHVRGWITRREAAKEKHHIVLIQSRVEAAKVIQSHVRGWITRREAEKEKHDIVLIQSRVEAAKVIQSHVRGWITRREADKEKHLIVLIQAQWRGYLARKNAKGQLLDLRLRVQKSAANVDDGMRLINRHIAALNELLSMKSLSNILRNCATLDKATGLSSNCCEILVAAGAIDILLKQIKSVSRSIPDQEILKHSLSILRNLVRYPHLTDALINHRESVQIIMWELLRNKEDGYFIACDLLKRLFVRKEGVEAVHRCPPSLLKRLHALVDDLTRKASKEKRNTHQKPSTRDSTDRRLKEAAGLLNMINSRR